MSERPGEFNVLVAGVGGQGVLTLAAIIAEAALKAGYEVKTSEIHGLSQRYGSVPVHIRFGSRVRSPVLIEGSADIIIALEPLEALKSAVYGARDRTTVVIDDYRVVPVASYIDGKKYPTNAQILAFMKGFAKDVAFVKASEEALQATHDRVMANIFLLGYLVGGKILPISEAHVLASMKESVRERFWESNVKIFSMGVDAGRLKLSPPLTR